jgi:hypothetical protein
MPPWFHSNACDTGVANVPVKGLNQIKRRIAEEERKRTLRITSALRAEAELIRTEVIRITPVDLGPLHNSIVVQEPVVTPSKVSVTISAGAGPSQKYALYVHEDLEARHEPPTRAKFLEQPLLAAAPHFLDRVAARLLNDE